jgi:hypothetical protein
MHIDYGKWYYSAKITTEGGEYEKHAVFFNRASLPVESLANPM